ncbi:hypothetical protein CORC01_00659 [Colletotrichum orchidophilum]|uniref:Glycan binding protein Y3-like domain-containing protein n=1 Tax=Colletotrichum orchidophilum TaxID=1209926 RepID=A0A1G4BR88_9PEZI|nr:uncharacterized protein CORC01_00659 [Colletotrichum orchidophilum]OHF03797.1 hypothetical protein CORC01_00659 [Colletotrichum orchidophilum]
MHFSLTTVLAFVASASACYSGGQAWGDSTARAIEFSGGENKYYCYNLGGNVRVDFRMRNGDTGGPRRRLDFNTCLARLRSQIENCNFGGEDNQGAWRPRADPNAGNC